MNLTKKTDPGPEWSEIVQSECSHLFETTRASFLGPLCFFSLKTKVSKPKKSFNFELSEQKSHSADECYSQVVMVSSKHRVANEQLEDV